MIYEHWGDNRSYKSAFNAWFAYLAFKQGLTVFCNCPTTKCILTFPHQHLSPFDVNFGQKELYNCYIMTDQSESSGLDSRTSMTVITREAGYFSGQAKKAGVDWHFDALRHKRVDISIRQMTDWYIHHIRWPPLEKVWYDDNGNYHDYPPAESVKLKILHRNSSRPKTMTFYRPFLEKLHKLYHTEVQIRPPRKTPDVLPDISSIHKQLVGP